MADAPSNFVHRTLTIPTLVGLLAAGILAPRFMPSGAQPSRAASAPSASAGAAATKGAQIAADDLLAEYLGVDRSTAPNLHAAVADAAALHRVSVDFLIATVSDPIDSYETWQFDPQVDAIRQGIEASGYLVDRFYLPGTGIDPKTDVATAATLRDLHTHWPGILLFRWKAAADSAPNHNDKSLLLVFLIPETPVAGIHQEPFSRAVAFAHAWIHDHPDLTSASDGIRILGPTYSGSTQAIIRGLVNFDQTLMRATGSAPRTQVSIISGSASNDSNRRKFESLDLHFNELTVKFRATMHSNSAIARGLSTFLKDAGIEGYTASLAESSTAYGSDIAGQSNALEKEAKQKEKADPEQAKPPQKDEDWPLSIKFPFNIAQLRRDAGRSESPAADPAAGGALTFRPLSFDDATVPTDQLPLQAPATTASSVELVLSNMLGAIRREHVRIIRLDATDIRDKLFLIKELRELAPDTLIVSTDADLFQVHPDQARWLRGLVVSSTYPLHTSSQNLVYPFHGERAAPRPNGELVQFSSANMEGYYNAAIAILNYDLDSGVPLKRFSARGQAGIDDLPKLIDYGGTGPGCHRVGEPGVWVSVVGDGEIIPLRVYCGLDTALGTNYVFRPNFDAGTEEPPSVHEVTASRPTVLLIIAVLILSLIAYRVAQARSDHVGSERIAALALGLCGVLVPLSALDALFFAMAVEMVRGGEVISALAVLAVAVGFLIVAIHILRFQRLSTELANVRGFFVAIAAMSMVYILLQIYPVPQMFLLRALDVGTRMSPLLPLVAFGATAIMLSAVEMRRLRAFGLGLGAVDARSSAVDHRTNWAACLDRVAVQATGGLEGIRDALIESHSQLFFLPYGAGARQRAWFYSPFVVAGITYLVVFRAGLRPILSVDGWLFGWTLVLVTIFLQWVFVTGLAQFLYLAHATAQFLSRLGRHPKSLPWQDVPKELSPLGLVPNSPRLRDLTPLADELADGLQTLQEDLDDQPPKRWFQSRTWERAQAEHATLIQPTADPGGSDARARKIAAIQAVLVVRELLSRLSFNLLTMGPVLVLLVVLYWTVYFDRSHALLGLIWFDVLLSMVSIMSVFIWMERDAVISGIRGTTAGEIEWNWDFISKVLVYVALPLLTLFATQFPDIGSSVLRLLEPVQRLPGS